MWPIANIAHALHLAIKPTSYMTGQVILLVYYIKLKSHLSVCLSVRPSDRHIVNSIVSAWIEVGLGLCTVVVSGM